MILIIKEKMHFNKLNKSLHHHNIHLFSAMLSYLMLFVFNKENSLYHLFRLQALCYELLRLSLYRLKVDSQLKSSSKKI